ncbi:MmcQ/YjbR family DNA-binding protein [Pontibacter sp. G13]|uniref:MmcQ/YjbR family DNA-binding protein n=1 Tax=Pontibacter sp. G13 TaxID=3074898 RepID=UPI00288AA347|nr:MmcQ/YjbR family DNA-binding protein [Pontibacter sp. G13]WNJ21318.1 MmcQ/YjbR family DNA-binding protein [Pontibacter sp. G13]
MNIESMREYCLLKLGVTEEFPFDEDTLVFKVMGKMFALTSLSEPVSMNLKCDPEYALELREKYPEEITPGFHMNKKHWNTVSFEGSYDNRFLQHLITHSYELVVAKLKKADREQLKAWAADQDS